MIATCVHNSSMYYRTVQNFDGGNIDEFDKFPAIRRYFPYQNFPFSKLLMADEFVAIQNEII